MDKRDLGEQPTTESEYERMLHELREVSAELREKIENGRVRSPEHEKVRIQQYRAEGYLKRTELKIMQARDIEDLEEMIEQVQDNDKNEFQIK